MTTLTLATKSNFRSERVINVSTVYTAQCAIGKVRVVQTQTSTSEEIWRTDKLSRAGAGESWEGVVARVAEGDKSLRGLPEVHVHLVGMLARCNPRVAFDSVEKLVSSGGTRERPLLRLP